MGELLLVMAQPWRSIFRLLQSNKARPEFRSRTARSTRFCVGGPCHAAWLWQSIRYVHTRETGDQCERTRADREVLPPHWVFSFSPELWSSASSLCSPAAVSGLPTSLRPGPARPGWRWSLPLRLRWSRLPRPPAVSAFRSKPDADGRVRTLNVACIARDRTGWGSNGNRSVFRVANDHL